MWACNDPRAFADATLRGRGIKSWRLISEAGCPKRSLPPRPGIGHSTLTLWLRKAAATKVGGPSTFVPVPNLFSTGGATPAYRLQFPRGLVVEVAPGFESVELNALLQLVQRL